MHISKVISKSGKKIIKALKKLSPQARLANKLQMERQSRARVSTRKDEKISMSWWSLEKVSSQDTLPVFECTCCCCQCIDDENLRNENLENEMLRC